MMALWNQDVVPCVVLIENTDGRARQDYHLCRSACLWDFNLPLKLAYGENLPMWGIPVKYIFQAMQ